MGCIPPKPSTVKAEKPLLPKKEIVLDDGSRHSNQTNGTGAIKRGKGYILIEFNSLICKGKSWVDPELDFKQNLTKINDMCELEKRFTLGVVLGEGITGQVRLCTSTSDQTLWAMKSLNLSRMDSAQIDELRAEIETLRKLDHPNIISVMEVFESPTNICIILEHCSGGDLSQRRFATENDVASVIYQLAEAVAHCHHMHIVHRDLKMENIMFASKDSDSLRLIDFGLSKKFLSRQEVMDYERGQSKIGQMNHTDAARMMQTACGTAYYMAPEMLTLSYSEKADVWAIGVITYMLVTGRPPFEGKDEATVFDKIRRGRVTYHDHIWKRLSPEALEFTKALLQYDPEKRPSAHDILDLKWLANFHKKRIQTLQGVAGATLARQVCDSLIRFGTYPPLKRAALMIIAHHIKEQDTRELRDMFLTLDEDHSGELTFQEINSMIHKFGGVEISEEELRKVFDAIDYEHTGVIHHTEFLAATLETRVKINSVLLRQAFEHLDIDGTGYLTADSLHALLGRKITRVDCEQIVTAGFKGVNSEGVSLPDFLEMMGETILPSPAPTPAPSDQDDSRAHSPNTTSTTSQSSTPEPPVPVFVNNSVPTAVEHHIYKPASIRIPTLPIVKEENEDNSKDGNNNSDEPEEKTSKKDVDVEKQKEIVAVKV